MKLFANIFGAIGKFFADTTSAGVSWWSYIEEEETPETLL